MEQPPVPEEQLEAAAAALEQWDMLRGDLMRNIRRKIARDVLEAARDLNNVIDLDS